MPQKLNFVARRGYRVLQRIDPVSRSTLFEHLEEGEILEYYQPSNRPGFEESFFQEGVPGSIHLRPYHCTSDYLEPA